MKIYRRPLALLLAVALLTIATGCATTQPVEPPRPYMTAPQARKALVESLNHLLTLKAVRDARFDQDRVTFTASVGSSAPRVWTWSLVGMNTLTVNVPAMASHQGTVLMNGAPLGWNGTMFDSGDGIAWFETEAAARMFVNAVLTLKGVKSTSPDLDDADFAAFTASAKTWLATTPKSRMPDDARTYKLLADDAYKRMDLAAALDAYCEALDKFPMWPSGHYNAAQLAAETEDYGLAARHMRRYLVLAPDASDARDAKDKLLLWQHKASQQAE